MECHAGIEVFVECHADTWGVRGMPRRHSGMCGMSHRHYGMRGISRRHWRVRGMSQTLGYLWYVM